MDPRFEQFIQERKYLCNASIRTLEWYAQAFHWLPNSNPDVAALKDLVLRMREKGLKACSVNSYRTAINAYLHLASHPIRIAVRVAFIRESRS